MDEELFKNLSPGYRFSKAPRTLQKIILVTQCLAAAVGATTILYIESAKLDDYSRRHGTLPPLMTGPGAILSTDYLHKVLKSPNSIQGYGSRNQSNPNYQKD